MGCAVATGLGAALYTADIEVGNTVAVFGVGGIGVNVIQGAKLAGAKKIIAIDINPNKKGTAMIFGATDFVDARIEADNLLEKIRVISDGGVDVSFECVGSPQLINTAIEASHIGWGQTVLIGIPSRGQQLTIDPYSLFNGRKLMSSWAGNTRMRSQLPKIVEWYLHGEVELDALVSHRFSLDDINSGFDLMKTGDMLRSVVIY
tara:strand:- start:59 stop:670 length:612 start_codon:yes stop_codon:yes gene_type:complete